MPRRQQQRTLTAAAAALAAVAVTALLFLPAASAATALGGAHKRRLQAVARQAPGPALFNWNLGHSTTPAVYVTVDTVEVQGGSGVWERGLGRSTGGGLCVLFTSQGHPLTANQKPKTKKKQDVIAIVADPKAYPSPLLPVVRRHSVTRCNVNDEGTVIDLTKLNRILGLERGGAAVRVQGGTLLKDIHEWLGQQVRWRRPWRRLMVIACACSAHSCQTMFQQNASRTQTHAHLSPFPQNKRTSSCRSPQKSPTRR